MRMPPPPRHGRWRAKFSTTGKPSPPSSPTPISRRQTTTPRRRCDMPSSLDASASAQEQTKGREPMPPFSASSKHAGDENSTRGRSSPKPSQTPEGASRLPCCLLPCCQPDKGEVNGYNGKWRSGLLASADAWNGGFAQMYGYFEARIKLPKGPGTWPAFWFSESWPRGSPPGVTVEI